MATLGGAALAAPGIDAGGITSTSRGAITALGGVHVNGVHFDTGAARFLINGVDGSATDLDVGKVVTVLGVVDASGKAGTAYAVVYNAIVEGPVEAVDETLGTLEVLGQTVVVTVETNFLVGAQNAGLTTGLLGDDVEVSGFRDADGRIVASFVGSRSAETTHSVGGIVTAVDPATMTFAINGLDVDYSEAALIDVPGGMPEVGQRLEVAGVRDPDTGKLRANQVVDDPSGIDAGGIDGTGADDLNGIDAGGTSGIDAGGTSGIDAGGTTGIDAGGIDAGGTYGIDAGGTSGIDAGGIDAGRTTGIDAGGIDAGGTGAKVEGHVQALPDAGTVTVAGTQFTLDSNTRFVNGGAESLALNRKVDVNAAVTANGEVVATSVEFERYAEERIAGQVDAVLSDAIIVDGMSLSLTGESSYRDLSAAALHSFTASNIYPGDAVEVIGYRSGDSFIVTRVDRHDAGFLTGGGTNGND
ncbi:MAG: DUF5666 domain-containing protein [Pseudomonadota bacterium]